MLPFAPSGFSPTSLRPPLTGALVWASALLMLGAAGWCAGASAQPTVVPAPATSAAAGAGRSAAVSKPLWRDLSAKQQQALQPLAGDWDGLAESHKRKWLALSRNHAKLSADEQATLRGRMTEWAALSQQQRAQARFNFAEVKQVPVDERKAKWEAYQSLSAEEKRRLAERATPRPPGAAGTIKPVPAQKLATVPAAGVKGEHSARIQLAPPAPAKTAPPMIVSPSISAEALAPVPVMPLQAPPSAPGRAAETPAPAP